MPSPFTFESSRSGILLILAMLVAFLGAAAKYSQFDGAPNQGYLSKAVKMAGARSELETSHQATPALPVCAGEIDLALSDFQFFSPAPRAFVPASLSFYPIRS